MVTHHLEAGGTTAPTIIAAAVLATMVGETTAPTIIAAAVLATMVSGEHLQDLGN